MVAPAMKTSRRLALLASGAYALALYLCPRSLRRNYGADMQLAFDARCRDAAQHGHFAILAMALREVLDVMIASALSPRESLAGAGRAGGLAR